MSPCIDETKRLLTQAKVELDDWAILSMVSTFERILFEHAKSPLRTKTLPEGTKKLNNAIKQFKKHVSLRTYEDVERLCNYRHWVAHGKRWGNPAHADPVSAHQRLVDFLIQAGLEPNVRNQFTEERSSPTSVHPCAERRPPRRYERERLAVRLRSPIDRGNVYRKAVDG